MIRKIQASEYLKRYDNMDAAERAAYLNRVGAWLAAGARVITSRVENDFNARLQNVLSISAGWNDAECAAFEEGVLLLTALMGHCDTWLPEMLYMKAAGRCVRQMVKCLNGLRGVNGAPTQPIQPTEKRKRGRPRKDEQSARMVAGVAKEAMMTPVGEQVVPVRPKHIDQYVHLLPEKTQERASMVKQLLTDMDRARENARLLMNDKLAHPDDIAKWAKMATSCDNKVKAIYTELDREWAKLVKSGRVVVDDLGNARVIGAGNGVLRNNNITELRDDEKDDESAKKDPNKRRTLRKWLGDTRRGNGATREEHVRKWRENFEEYLTIEGEKAYSDEKIKAAAKHYGIELKVGSCDIKS